MNALRKVALLCSVLAAGALLAGCGGGGAADLRPEDVAVVGPQHITKARFEQMMNQARSNLAAQGQAFPKAGTTQYDQIKSEAIVLLVQDAQRELKAQELGVTVNEKAIVRRLVEIKQQYFGGDDKRYRAQLKQQGLTDKQVREEIRSQLLAEKIFDRITAETTVSDEEVHDYYVEHLDTYTSRKVRHILVDDKKLADRLYAQLKDGADFAQLAKRYSQDPGSKDQGGKFVARKGQDVPEFDRAAFALQDGQISQPVKTEYGWHIIQATGPVVKTPEKTVAPTIRKQLLDDKRNAEITQWLDNATKELCTSGKIRYQVGYRPNPDPCARYTAPPTTTAP